MTPPNIIILVLDTVRARNLSLHGYPLPTTPHIADFAGRNQVFERAFTTSTWTIPTHRSMLSGLYLSEHGIVSLDPNLRFNPEIVSMPAALRNAGYHTAGFSQNLLFSPHFHFDSFDEFHTTEETSGQAPLPGRRQPQKSRLEMLQRYWAKTRNLGRFTNRMADWVTARPANSPFLLVANISHVHAPWAPSPALLLKKLGRRLPKLLKPEFSAPKPFVFNSHKKLVSDEHRETWRRLYDAALMHTDQAVGALLNRLAGWPGWENTIFVLTSDHGEMLGDHSGIVGHTLTLSDHIMHIPMIVRHPDYSRPARIKGVVQLLDLFPSALEWAGAEDGVPEAQRQRRPMSWAMDDPADESGAAFAEEDYTGSYDVIAGLRRVNQALPLDHYPRRQIAIRTAHHKLVRFDDRSPCVYDLRSDPDERQPVAENDPAGRSETIAALNQQLDAWERSRTFLPPENTAEDHGNVDERLRDLGYLP